MEDTACGHRLRHRDAAKALNSYEAFSRLTPQAREMLLQRLQTGRLNVVR